MRRWLAVFPALLAGLLLTALPLARAAAPLGDCLPQVRVPLVVQIGAATAVPALLEGGIDTPLLLRDAATGRLLWSAAKSAAIQTFDEMEAGFAGSLAALDLDGDGRHDRLYAGDLSGRVWRFDMQHGAPAASWLTGGVFADFNNVEGRGFLAAPDLSVNGHDGTAWLDIAVGTAAPGNAAASNRFYVLRDHDYLGNWMQRLYDDHEAIREDDLVRVPSTVGEATEAVDMPAAGPGWYLELGSGQVFAPSLTVNHRTTLVIASGIPRGGSCEILPRILTLDLRSPSVAADEAEGPRAVPRAAVRASAVLELVHSETSPALVCVLDGEPVAGCTVDTRPTRTWWRRDDAP